MLEKSSSKPGSMSEIASFIDFVKHVAALKMSVMGFVLTPHGFGEDPGPIEAENSLPCC